MKIYGDKPTTEFKTYVKEPGCLFGSNDVLKGDKISVYTEGPSFFVFGTSTTKSEYEPKLYLHIPTNTWTTITGKLREYFSPWYWDVAYLDKEDGSAPQRILIHTTDDNDSRSRIKKLMGKSLFITKLIKEDFYIKKRGDDFICIKDTCEPRVIEYRSLTQYTREWTPDSFCPIYHADGLLTSIKYFFLKTFSSSWKEVALHVDGLTQKILIKKEDEPLIAKTGLLKS